MKKEKTNIEHDHVNGCYHKLQCPNTDSQGSILETDVLIIGTGPVGATYARKILDETNARVLMIDIGALGSPVPGENLKNTSVFQHDVNKFAHVIRGHLQTLSVPVNTAPTPTLGPGAFRVPVDLMGKYDLQGQNRMQDAEVNLPGAAATYMVGGMATHWTAACPRMHPTIERPEFFNDAEWDELYSEAEELFHVSRNEFDHSIRHNTVKEILRETYDKEIMKDEYKPNSLPLAARRRIRNSEFVEWSSSATILGEHAVDPAVIHRATNPSLTCNTSSPRFRIMEQHICRKLIRSEDNRSIAYAEVENLLHKNRFRIHAKNFVVACGTVLSAQLLWASEIRPKALGKYLTEQPMAFCQVVLNETVINRIENDHRYKEAIDQHKEENPCDPIPIPYNDPDPQCIIPVSENRPWHCQIHRDAFAYGDTAPNVDPRLIVDFRWFGIVKQSESNCVEFHEGNNNMFGMPQPTFNYVIDSEDGQILTDMMQDMLKAATSMGQFLPGSNPQFMSPGLSEHIHGVTRMGLDAADSVVNTNSCVWGLDNCFVAGLGVLSKASACNPTITSAALAIRAANFMAKNGSLPLKVVAKSEFKEVEPAYAPEFISAVVQDNREDGYWLEGADMNNNGFEDLIGYGLNVGEVTVFLNPNSTSDDLPTSEWESHIIQTLKEPVGMQHADINRNGFTDLICTSEYGPTMDELNEEGGLIHWLEHPGKDAFNSPTPMQWKKHYIGRATGMHRICVGHFTQMDRLEIIGLPVVGKAGDLYYPCDVKLFRAPKTVEELNKCKQWEEVKIDDQFFHIIHGFELKKHRLHSGIQLDSLLLASQEGVTFFYYCPVEKTFKKNVLVEGTVSEFPVTGFKGVGNVCSGRYQDDPFAYLASIEPFHGNVGVVYIRDRNSAPVGDLVNSTWTRHVLNVYGDPNEQGEGPGHHIETKDVDNDGNDEIFIALRGDAPTQGVMLYKPLDFFKGVFAKFHVSTESAARMVFGDFNHNGKLDFATIGYNVKKYYEAVPCQVNIHYNNFSNSTIKMKSGIKMELACPSDEKCTEVVVTLPNSMSTVVKSEFLFQPLVKIQKFMFNLAYLPPQQTIKIGRQVHLKVLKGSLYWKASKDSLLVTKVINTAPPNDTESMILMSDSGFVWTNDDECIFLWITPDADTVNGEVPYINSVEEVNQSINPIDVGGTAVHFQFEEYKGMGFYNSTGFKVQRTLSNKTMENICHLQFWLAGKGVDCRTHDHADNLGKDAFCEIHACLVNGTGHGAMYRYNGKEGVPIDEMKDEDFTKLVVPTGYEHGPLWDMDKEGRPERRSDGSVVYRGHKWMAGKGNPMDESESFDFWMAVEINPDLVQTLPANCRQARPF